MTRTTNLGLDKELVAIAKVYFRNTRHRSLTGFVNSKLRTELRAAAPRLRKAGVQLPSSLFPQL